MVMIIGNDVKAVADEHWKWLESVLHKVYVDAFVHGFKHGYESAGGPVEFDSYPIEGLDGEKNE